MEIKFYDLTIDELTVKSIEQLNHAGIAVTPGSLVRSFLDIANVSVSNLASLLYERSKESFLSTATTMASVEAIASIFGLTAEAEESIDNFKFRVANAVRTMASQNRIAVDIAARSIEGISDVLVLPAAFGPGTIQILVEAEDGTIPSDNLLDSVFNIVTPQIAAGTSLYVHRPEYRDIRVFATFYGDNNPVMVRNVTSNIENIITDVSIGTSIDVQLFINELAETGKIYQIGYTLDKVLVDGSPVVDFIEIASNEKAVLDRGTEKSVDIRIRRVAQ